jgi:uncharacterized cupin superfamily protein
MSEMLYSCRYAFPVPVDRLYQAIQELATWGGLRDAEPGVRLRFEHGPSGGLVEAAVSARGEGSQVMVKLFADVLDRQRLDAFSRQTYQIFEDLERRLGVLPENVHPDVWPGVHVAPGTAPRVLRRAAYKWQPSSYRDAPQDLMGEYAPLTGPLGVTQFGADVHRLAPGQRNCRNHAEVNEQEGFLVLSGTCHIEVEGRVIALATGDFCVTFPGEEHFLYNASDAPCEVLCFGGPDLVGSGASYPHGRDETWRDRVGRQEPVLES